LPNPSLHGPFFHLAVWQENITKKKMSQTHQVDFSPRGQNEGKYNDRGFKEAGNLRNVWLRLEKYLEGVSRGGRGCYLSIQSPALS